jgi:Protein of unknown function (DUF1156)
MDAMVAKPKIVRFSLKDAPSLIERVWPAQKISVETFKERDAKQAQTLTSLGSYWKGRKPLVLVRACILAALLPATDDSARDIEIFEILMGMHDDQSLARFKTAITVEEFDAFATDAEKSDLAKLDVEGFAGFRQIPKEVRDAIMSKVVARMPYQKRIEKLHRPEEIPEVRLLGQEMAQVNASNDRKLICSIDRAAGHYAFRSSAAGRRHFCRRWVDPFRGGTHGMRRLCFRFESDSLLADLGCTQRDRRNAGSHRGNRS